MAFCSHCGTKLEDGAKFCPSCGTKTEAGAPPPQQVYQQPAPPQAQGYQPGVQAQQTYQQQKDRNALLRAALIVTPVIWLIYVVAIIVMVIKTITTYHVPIGGAVDKETWLVPLVLLVILAIPTALNILGQKKNNRVMMLIAGILYFFTTLGIPSAILCFIALIKTKKA